MVDVPQRLLLKSIIKRSLAFYFAFVFFIFGYAFIVLIGYGA